MKAYDVQAKAEVEVTVEDLMKLLDSNRQVDLVFSEPRTDEDGLSHMGSGELAVSKRGKISEKLFPERKSPLRFHSPQ